MCKLPTNITGRVGSVIARSTADREVPDRILVLLDIKTRQHYMPVPVLKNE